MKAQQARGQTPRRRARRGQGRRGQTPIRALRGRRVGGKTVTVLFLCAGIAFLALLTGGEHPSADALRREDPMVGYYPEAMPRYPGARELPAGPSTRVGGTKLRMSHFTTTDEPHRVARFYSNYWKQQRFFVHDDMTHVGGVVSAVDAQSGRIYQILVSVQGPTTNVFPSVTESPLRALDTGNLPPPVPLYPDSRAVIAMNSDEGENSAQVHLSLNDGGLEDNVTHFRRELRLSGYHRENSKDPQLGDKHRVLLYRKQNSEITVNLAALDEETVRVHLMIVKAR